MANIVVRGFVSRDDAAVWDLIPQKETEMVAVQYG